MPDVSLTPEEVRQLVRTCAVAVEPGETLIIQVPEDWTPNQVYEMQRYLNWTDKDGTPLWPFRTLVVPGERLGVAAAGQVTVTHEMASVPDTVFAEQLRRVMTHEAKRQGWKWPPA